MDQIGGAESQTRALVEWCAKQGIANYEIFTDHGISGAKESRPALNRLMQKVEDGEVEQVVVFAFSRFARSTSHLLRALEKFRSKSVRFQSITESRDTNSPMGLALLTILGCLSQLERELLRERVLELDTLRLLGFVKNVEHVCFRTVARIFQSRVEMLNCWLNFDIVNYGN